MSSIQTPTETEIRSTLAEYLTLLQTHPSAEQLVSAVVTDDFECGFARGPRWQGIAGLRQFLALQAGFFDELHEVKDVLSVHELPGGETGVETRLEFFLRRWTAPDAFSEEFTGWCFHSWRLRATADGTEFRIAAQIADRFEHLNDNADRFVAQLLGESHPG